MVYSALRALNFRMGKLPANWVHDRTPIVSVWCESGTNAKNTISPGTQDRNLYAFMFLEVLFQVVFPEGQDRQSA